MMRFTLLPEAVQTVRADSKAAIITSLAERFGGAYSLDPVLVHERLEERERLGSTGFGRGVAIPHARIPGLECPVTVFFRLETATAFDAADDLPVDFVFGLLSPEHSGVVHLHALAAISRMMRDEAMHHALAQAPSDEALYGLLSNGGDQDVA